MLKHAVLQTVKKKLNCYSIACYTYCGCCAGELEARTAVVAALSPACDNSYHQRSELEYTCFQTDFQNFCNIFFDNFCKIFSDFYKISSFWHQSYQNHWNSEEIPKKIGEILIKICKICCLSWNSAKIAPNSVKNGAKVLKNQKNLEWCKGNNESSKNAEKCDLGRKNRRWYSRKRASESVWKTYILKDPAGYTTGPLLPKEKFGRLVLGQ